MFTGQIYLITNIVNNRKYVGQTTSSLKQRFLGHIRPDNIYGIGPDVQKFGKENFKIESLHTCEANSKEELSALLDHYEQMYIEKYITLGVDYNKQSGGKTKFICCKETKDKISLLNKGKHVSQETKDKTSLTMTLKCGKPVDCYTLDGKFIKHFESRHAAEKFLSKRCKIAACCNGHRKSAGGYVWKWSE